MSKITVRHIMVVYNLKMPGRLLVTALSLDWTRSEILPLIISFVTVVASQSGGSLATDRLTRAEAAAAALRTELEKVTEGEKQEKEAADEVLEVSCVVAMVSILYKHYP